MSEQQEQKHSLFAKWTETELSPREQSQFELWCQQDEEFADRVATHGKLQQVANQFDDFDVPDWQPEKIFEQPDKKAWWQWSPLPALSFGMSAFAIVLVLLRIEVTVANGAMTLSFAGTAQQQKVEQLVEQKLQEYTQMQQVAFNQRTQQMQDQQMQLNTQLTSYLLTTSRTERREDFAELIKFVNQQRADDQVFYAKQFNRLQNDISADVSSYNRPEPGIGLPATEPK